MTQALLEFVFDGEPDVLASVKELYAKAAAPAKDEQVVDNDLMLLLEEMGLTDTMNATEWHEDRKKAVRSKTRNLNRQREEKRRVRAEKQKRIKKVRKTFIKKGKGKGKGTGKRTRAQPAPGTAVTDGTPPVPGAPGTQPAPGTAGTHDTPPAPGAAGTQPAPGVAGTDGNAGAAGKAAAVNAARPTEGGGWLVITTSGGWIRFNEKQQKIDSHCSQHGHKCKMDRMMSRGSIGLACAWLGTTCNMRSDHIIEKACISSFDSKAARVAARAAFVARAKDSSDSEGEKCLLLLASEMDARKATSEVVEPDLLKCPDISRELSRALESGE